MHKSLLFIALFLSAGCAVAQPVAEPVVEASESVLPLILPLDNQVETVADGYAFTEGPAVGPDGKVYFTDITPSRIMQFDPATGETLVFREDSGGANGLFFYNNHLYACEGDRRRVGVYKPLHKANGDAFGHTPASSSVAAEILGAPFNKPNDLTVDAKGGVYFTDPDFGNRKGPKPPVEGVYYVTPEGQVTCVVDNLARPNGVALTHDGTRIYIQDVGANLIQTYDVVAPGQLENPQVFADVAKLNGGIPDGLCIGPQGNVYTALYTGGAIVVHDENGQQLQMVGTGPATTNCVLGPDGKYLYVTADKSLKRIRLAP
ncbi:MAG: SMP-30/gluconolactonase/LRE family protein [Algisphaera sp.]